ncbi:MAG: TRAP transporter substrate-binding protein DctP [Acetomicrobium flavidum]|uniref:TRAP transporter substrate-binding protein DctP n=1 Tax=Acetomicrobium flavidum TaxID=49896 RepID=UPI00169110D6|nr:TRAP transporter substrate-binding protein DctP [Acetomicrobium flavidum]
MKRLISFISVLCILLSLSSPSFAAVEIKIGHVLTTDSAWHVNLEGFAKEVAEKTEGRVIFKIYPGSQLGNEKDLIEGLMLQTIDGGLIGGGSFQSIDPRFGVEALPYAWKDHQTAYKAMDGEIGKFLLGILESKGIKGISWWENGFRHITNNKRPIVVPKDMEGLKIRVTPDKMRLDTFKALGASPIPINFGELYTALQQGVVDAQENPLGIIYANAFYEVQKYLSLSGHTWGSALLCFNSSAWKRIPDKDKPVVEAIANKWRDRERQQIINEESDMLAKLKEKGMKVNEVDKEAFKAAVQPVWKDYESVFGKDLMELVRKYGK